MLVTAAMACVHRIVPAGVAGAFLPDRIADLPVRDPPSRPLRRRNRHRAMFSGRFHFERKAYSMQSFVNLHRIGAAYHRLAAVKIKRRQFGRRRRDRRRRASAAALPWAARRFGAAATLGVSIFGRLDLRLFRPLGFSGGFSFIISTEIFFICLPSNPAARREIEHPPPRGARGR